MMTPKEHPLPLSLWSLIEKFVGILLELVH